MVLVSLCLLARAELLLLSWPSLKTSKGTTGLSVFFHSSRFVQKTPCVPLQAASLTNSPCDLSAFRSYLTGSAGLYLCLMFNTYGASSAQTVERFVQDVGFSLCGQITLEAVETCELRTHQSCQNASNE